MKKIMWIALFIVGIIIGALSIFTYGPQHSSTKTITMTIIVWDSPLSNFVAGMGGLIGMMSLIFLTILGSVWTSEWRESNRIRKRKRSK